MKIDNIIDTTIHEFLVKEFRSCLGVPNYLLEFDRDERETLLIVEERSVLAVKYREVIRMILETIDDCFQMQRYETLRYDLNKIEEVDFDWTKRFIVIIFFTLKNTTQAKYLPSYTKVNPTNPSTIEEMNIVLYINPNDYKWKNMEKYLYHEINHTRDDAGRISNGSLTLNDLQNNNASVRYEQSFQNLDKDATAQIIHYLFVDTEFNAYNTHLYAELGHLNSKRDNFSHDLKQTESYKRYNQLKYLLNLLNSKEGWEDRAMSYFRNLSIPKEKFRKWFLSKSKRKLQDMWYRFGKIASLYYDNAEEAINKGEQN